jgi:periplasmic divalent cation tolerance protein
MTDKIIVLSTAGAKEEARSIADALVERKLAACVNIVGPIESVFRWKGDVDFANEFLLVVKTTASAFERVRDAIKELHSYDLPECIRVSIEDGSAAYLKWMEESVSLGGEEKKTK